METIPAIPHREQIKSIEFFKNEIVKELTEFKLEVAEILIPAEIKKQNLIIWLARKKKLKYLIGSMPGAVIVWIVENLL